MAVEATETMEAGAAARVEEADTTAEYWISLSRSGSPERAGAAFF
jgi:hypothetical protein